MAPQTATRVASGRLVFGAPTTTDGKLQVKGGSRLSVRSLDNNGRRVAVEAVNGAARPNGAAAVADVRRQVPAPPPPEGDGDGVAFRLGKFAEGRLVYRQQFVVRSYEIGPDRTATMETLMNLLQVRAETVFCESMHAWFTYAMHRSHFLAWSSLVSICAGDGTEPCDVLWARRRRFRRHTADESQEAHLGRHKNQHPGRRVQQMVRYWYLTDYVLHACVHHQSCFIINCVSHHHMPLLLA